MAHEQFQQQRVDIERTRDRGVSVARQFQNPILSIAAFSIFIG